MKYVKIGKKGCIQSYCAIDVVTHIPSKVGDDVLMVWTTTGARISLFGRMCCALFLAEFEYPTSSALDWTEDKMRLMTKKDTLAFYSSTNELLFEY